MTPEELKTVFDFYQVWYGWVNVGDRTLVFNLSTPAGFELRFQNDEIKWSRYFDLHQLWSTFAPDGRARELALQLRDDLVKMDVKL